MDLGLKDKVALVTGAGSQVGFGKGIVTALANEGCDIIVCDIDIEGAEKTASDVKAMGRKAIALKVDITSRDEVKAAVDAAIKEMGRIDILVNNAGVGTKPVPFVESTEKDWDISININLRGTLYVTQAVLPFMIEQKSGKIVSMSSTVALSPMATAGVYGAAKAGVIIFTATLAKELEDVGINVNCIAPGLGNTNFHVASEFPQEFADHFLKEMVEAGKTTTPEDIGSTVAFLVSDVSRKINGQCIRVSDLSL